MSGLRRRDFIKIAGSAMATGAFIDFLGNPLVSNVNKKKRPNVILILVDDLGYGDLSCHGNPVVKTPNIDHLYHQSARLTNFHVDPTCSPTRASLLTGRYSSRAGVWHTIMGRSILPKDEVTMAEIFSRNGYKTGIFGKWHLGDNAPFRACDRGFAESLVLGGGAIGNTPDYWDNDYFDDFYSHNGTWEKQSGYCTDVFFKAAMNFIEGVAGQPFFCYLPTNVVHWPHNVAEDYTKPYRGLVPDTRATFYGMLSNLDENIGKLLQFLKAKGLDKDTILIFMSDNGTSFGAEFDRQGFVTKGYNAGMRSHKGSVYEGGHRVPCFIRWPGGGIPSGRDIQGLAAHIDILPTLIDLCGLDVEKDLIFDGLPLSPFLKDNNYKWPERTLIIHNQRVDIPIKGKDYVVMTSIWRLVNGKELYNIREDPGQHRDLSKQYPEVVKKLNEDYEQWWNDISRRFNEYIWIPVGTDKENPVKLTTHDIHGQVCWDQRHVRRNSRCDGFWTIEIVRDGVYVIEVSRWPKESGLSLWEAPEGAKVFRPTHARLKIGCYDFTLPVHEDDKSVKFTLRLSKQQTRLQAWLINDIENGQTNSAFYVYLRRKD